MWDTSGYKVLVASILQSKASRKGALTTAYPDSKFEFQIKKETKKGE